MPLSAALYGLIMSLSARRAWIEISRYLNTFVPAGVALRKESVDRNGFVAPDVSSKIW